MSDTFVQVEGDALSSVSFEQIIKNESILDSIRELGFSAPTDVQAKTIPQALGGGDLIVQAQTGSGKTLSFGIPLLSRLFEENPKKNSTFGLIIAPTRELAVQVKDALRQISGDIEPSCLIGGADINAQKKSLEKDARVVIGTPGRILDLIRQRALNLSKCRYFALDEADEMLSMGFIEDIRAILSRLPDRRQGLFVSATITGRVEMLARSFLNKPEQILIGQFNTDIPDIEHLYCEVGGELMAKPSALCDLIQTMRPRSAIIFCNTKSDTTLVESFLRRRGFDARRINSDLTQAKRERIMNKIRAQDLQFLVATDIAARGIDIEQIDLVINYNIHDQTETYIHRTGRTGRAGRSGKAVSLIGPRDHGAFHFLKKVVDFEFTKLDLPQDDEVADARLAHLYELIRKGKIEVSERDMLVAKKLMKDLGGIESPEEELAQIVAKLCRFSVEHYIAAEAKALDEELEASPEEKQKKSRDKKGERESKGSRSKEKRRKEDESGSERRPSREQRDAPEEVRVYLGLGSHHGLSRDSFLDIAASHANIDEEQLRKLSIREHYGFVDLLQPHADTLIENLKGVQFQGTELVVEKAASLSDRRRRNYGGGNRRGSRNSSGGRNSRGGDSRGGGRSRSDSRRGQSRQGSSKRNSRNRRD